MSSDPRHPCQRWREGTASWRRVSDGGFDRRRYGVIPLEHTDAKEFVVRHHYSGSFCASRLAYGLYGPSGLCGVAVLGVPMRAAVLTNVFPQLTPYSQTLELARFVLLDEVPANGESWMLGRVFALAAEAGLRGIVSFADPMARYAFDEDGRSYETTPGHCGLIYQATNARALGRSTPRTLTLVNGRVLSARTLQKIRAGESGCEAAEEHLRRLGAPARQRGQDRARWLAHALDRIGAYRVRHPGNYRYAWPVGLTRRERATVVIAPQRTGYPKPRSGVIAAPNPHPSMVAADISPRWP